MLEKYKRIKFTESCELLSSLLQEQGLGEKLQERK